MRLKMFFSVFLLGILVSSLSALDFTAKEGTVYKNATVLKVMPDGIVISFADANGDEYVDHISTALLPDDLKKEYKLTDTEAAAYDAQRAAEVNSIESQKAAADKAYYAEQKKEYDQFNKITDYLNAVGVNIIFNSVNQTDFASIGYAYRSVDFDKEAPFGLICLMGQSIEPDEDWVGNAYPLNKTIAYTEPFKTLNPVNDEIEGYGPQGGYETPPQEEHKKMEIPCYGDYQTALDYFSNHPEAVGK